MYTPCTGGSHSVGALAGIIYGRGTGPVHLNRVQCDESESRLIDCSYSILTVCALCRDVAVQCIGKLLNVLHTQTLGNQYNGKIWRVLYLANEPFERNWWILIWRLKRGYYSTDVVSTGKLFTLAINGQIRQIAKLKVPSNFPVMRYTLYT